jgi:hypothetical protein
MQLGYFFDYLDDVLTKLSKKTETTETTETTGTPAEVLI